MKKRLSILVVLLLVGGTLGSIIFFQSSKPSEKKIAPNKERIIAMEKLNLTHSREYEGIQNYDMEMNADLVKRYRKDYGLEYISEKGLEILKAQNDLITAPTSLYIGHINIDANKVQLTREAIDKEWTDYITLQREKLTAEAKKAGKEVIDAVSTRTFIDHMVWLRAFDESQIELPEYRTGELYIIAPKEMIMLEDGQRIIDRKVVVPRDPLLIQQVKEGGYVILAKW